MDNAWIIQVILIPILTVLLNSIVISFREKYKRNLEKDNQLFEIFIDQFPEDSDLIYLLKEHNFRYPIPRTLTKNLESMLRLIRQSSHIYMNRKIERAKINLQHSIESFFKFSIANLFPSEQEKDKYVTKYYDQYIGFGWSEEIQEEFFIIVEKFDLMTTDIYNQYAELVKIARKHS